MNHIATWIEKDRGKHFDDLFAGSDFRLWNARVEEVPWPDVRGLMLGKIQFFLGMIFRGKGVDAYPSQFVGLVSLWPIGPAIRVTPLQ